MGLFIDCHILFEVQLLGLSLHIEVQLLGLSLHIEALPFKDSEWSRGC